MKLNKTLSILLLLALFCGCSRGGRDQNSSVMSFGDAEAIFVAGMTPDEFKGKCGEPTFLEAYPNQIRWSYMPIREIERGGRREYSGFSIILVDGRSVKISESATVVN